MRNKYLILYFLALNIISLRIYSINAPLLYCVSTDGSGNVTINWNPPSDTGAYFTSYKIYSSLNRNNSYTLLSTINNYAITSSVVGNTSPVYYYLLHESDGSTISSDTICSIFLNITSTTSMVANLSWNSMYPASNPLSDVWYLIYREYPAGTWVLIDSTKNLTYKDTVATCGANINYNIKVRSPNGCMSNSNTSTIFLKDEIVPDTPLIDSVSVDTTTGNTIIGWYQGSAGDISGYIIYQESSTSWKPIDTIYGKGSTLYTNTSSSANSTSEVYRVASFDSCFNTSPMGVIHNTIFLTVALDVCNGQTNLSWNKYINWQSDVSKYQVYAVINNNTTVLLGETSAENPSFTHDSLISKSTYCYFIKAIDGSGTKRSTSNKVCIIANTPQQAFYNYLNLATVNDNNNVEVSFYYDINANVDRYKILRSTSFDGEYTLIGVVYPPDLPYPNPPILTYTDNTALTDFESYYYKVVVVDSCHQDAINSNIARTILLNGIPNSDITNTLSWNDYYGWLGDIDSYNLYRTLDDEQIPILITTLPYNGSNEYVYNDDVAAFSNDLGKFTYFVEANEKNINIYNLQEKSYSNRKVFYQRSKFLMPNTFNPNSDIASNRIIKPVFVNMDLKNYLFIIYDRWGLPVFQTTNKDEGWNGIMAGGKSAPAGIYLYYCVFQNNQGVPVKKTGAINLLR